MSSCCHVICVGQWAKSQAEFVHVVRWSGLPLIQGGGATCRALVGIARLCSPLPPAVSGWDRKYKGKLSWAELLKEPDTSCPLPNWETAADPCGTEDWLVLPEPHADQAKEQLPGLPLAFYPNNTEDPLQTQVRSEGEIGSSPGDLDNSLVESWPVTTCTCCRRIPTDGPLRPC